VPDTHFHRNEFDLSDRVVILTGAAGLIGSEVADAYASYGAVVVVTDALPEGEMVRAASKLQTLHGGRCLGLHFDVTSNESVSIRLCRCG
jgi:3-hydroxybutyrate dehydrogenase